MAASLNTNNNSNSNNSNTANINANANVVLIERNDVHKSCKALENIVNVFNDYCQLAESLAVEQKKLARALKEAVGLKATNELAGMFSIVLTCICICTRK